jgi:hypothetical protein
VTPLNGNINTATGFYFSSLTNGVVTLGNDIEHFDGPTHIDVVALDGAGMLPGPADDTYDGFIVNSLGLIARGSTSESLIVSTDMGKSFTYSKMYGSVTVPSGSGIPLKFPYWWLGKDSSNVWHIADTAGGLWSSPTPPGPTADFTLTWHPEGTITVPSTVPPADCQAYGGTGYYATQLGQNFAVTPDGNTMVYGGGICRSTDGGKNFVDDSTHIMPSSFTSMNTPWLFMFTSPTVGIAAYGSDGSLPQTAYVLYTTDGGANWTVGTLPPSASNTIALIGAFASPTGTMFMVGAGDGLFKGTGGDSLGLLLYKSTDGGQTWTDLSANLAQWAMSLDSSALRLSTGFALDDQHLWIGGDSGFIAYTSTGGQ